MTTPPPSYDLIREMKEAVNHRRRLATYVRHRGIVAAVPAFQTSFPTVPKGLRCYQLQGVAGLQELSRAWLCQAFVS